MKLLTVVGARPNFMKAAPIIAAIQNHNSKVERGEVGPTIQHILVHTGQHYDAVMSGSFFADLNLRDPDIELGIGSGSHAVQTAEILRKFETVLLTERPDAVVVVGDVNSTMACALATAKITFDASRTRPLLAHVESGLRSFDRLMPEEVNRVVTDHIADLLLVTEDRAVENLQAEGISHEKIHFVGNTMIDSLLKYREKAETSDVLERLGVVRSASYALLTLHRPSNVDSRDTFVNIIEGLEELARECSIVFPVHPRTRKQIAEFGLEHRFRSQAQEDHNAAALILTEPLGYLDFVCLMKNAALVVTDSGGIQEETTCLGVPCVTIRENTERPVTVSIGTNVIAGTTKAGIQAAVRRQLRMGSGRKSAMPRKWDGHAGDRVVEVLIQSVERRFAPQVVSSVDL